MRVIPLGGCGEFGRNLTAYVAAGLLLLVDCGIEMPDDLSPGVDHFVPDLRDLLGRFGLPTAVLLTHGHEDHIGAVGHLLHTVGQSVPVYGRPLTLRLCQNRLQRHGVPRRLHDLRPLQPEQPVWFGLRQPGDREAGMLVTPLAVPHSIPESCALLIQGPLTAEQVGLSAGDGQPRAPRPLPAGAYTVLHTGDYKLEEFATSLGLPATAAEAAAAGDSARPSYAIDLLVGDSTNAAVPGRSGSEREVAAALGELLHSAPGRVAVTLFSSHIVRIGEFAQSCVQAGRRLCLLGRGLRDAVAAALDCGVLYLPPGLLCTAAEAAALPPVQVALLCTGSQGEATAALGRLVAALLPEVPSPFPPLRLSAGDTVVLAARAIPGHERVLGRLCDRLCDAGVRVLSGPRYSASGHGCRDELSALLNQVRPRALLPVHGTARQLAAHAELGEAHGVPALRCRDGDVVRLSTSALTDAVTIAVEPGERVAAGHLAIEGSSIGEVGPATLRTRRQISHTGVVVVAPGPAGLPSLRVRALGVSDPGPALLTLCEAAEAAASAVLTAAMGAAVHLSPLQPLAAPPLVDDKTAAEVARVVRRTFALHRGCKPTVLSLLAGRELQYDELDESGATAG
jgi:ribonuclease J